MPRYIDTEIPEAFEFLFTPMRYKGAWGGRGSAKSRSVARSQIVESLQSPLLFLNTREIQKSIKDSVKVLLENDIDRLNLNRKFSIRRDEIIGKNGSHWIFAGLRHNAENIKSIEGVNRCWIEQAEAVSKESLKILTPTIREPGSEICFTYNLNKKTDPIHDRFWVNKPDNCLSYKLNYWDNPFFPDVLRDEMEYDKKHDYDKYLHVWEGEELKFSDALVFKDKWRSEIFEAPEDTTFYYGADWGFSQDPTVLVRCFLDNDKKILYVDYEAYGVGVEIDHTPALFDQVPESRRWRIKADSARPETISYMKRHGFKITGAKKGAGSVIEGINFLKNYTIVVHERCKHVIDELKFYSYKIDKLTEEILPLLEDKKNHIIDALRYALENIIRKPKVLIG